jgi:endonuclease/exonuclease/phosphatase family metal-dependent hydrolase
MAIPFRNPNLQYTFDTYVEKSALLKHFKERQIPRSSRDKLLLATWNIANLGAQKRTHDAKSLIAYILKRFDLIAVQEINENYQIFAEIVGSMGSGYDYIMNDTAGNNERLAYIYRKSKVKPRNLFGEVALYQREYPKRTVTVNYTERGVPNSKTYKDVRFVPFDRNPFIASFRTGALDFTLVNAHLYFGRFQSSKKPADHAKFCRRVLEIYALARWANRRATKDSTYDQDIILLGDMNIPRMAKNESTYKALVRYGMQPLDYLTKTGGTNLGNDKTYDQLAFAPGIARDRIIDYGVFDFDNALFKSLWQQLGTALSLKKTISKFNSYVKYQISDHRPIWVQLDLGQR